MGILDIDLLKILIEYYQPDVNKKIFHVFKTIDAIQSINIVKQQFKLIEYDKDGLLILPKESEIIREGFEFDGFFLIFPEFLRAHESLIDWIAENHNNKWELKFLIDKDFQNLSFLE